VKPATVTSWKLLAGTKNVWKGAKVTKASRNKSRGCAFFQSIGGYTQRVVKDAPVRGKHGVSQHWSSVNVGLLGWLTLLYLTDSVLGSYILKDIVRDCLSRLNLLLTLHFVENERCRSYALLAAS